MKKLLHTIGLIGMLAILLGSLGVDVARAKDIDEDFFAGNDILFYNPNLSQCASASSGAANIDVDKGFNLGPESDGKTRRVNLAKALMKDFGLTAEQASGVVGNFMRESGGDFLPPDVNEGGHKGPPAFSGGYGWAQWTGPRQRAFIDYAVQNGFMPSAGVNANDAANYAWLKYELTNTEKNTIPELKKATTPEDAADAWERAFERAQVKASAEREQGARQTFGEINGGGGSGPSASSGACSNTSSGIVGNKAFPLKTTKAAIDAKNPGMFANNTASKGGHPYTAFDILADPGTEVLAFISGTVTAVTEDKCPGRMISIYNKDTDLTVSYLHMNMDPGTHIAQGATVTQGQHVGQVGPPAAGCGTPHLHIDAAKGNSRPGCKREDCPAANAAKFVDIGPDLFTTYQALP